MVGLPPPGAPAACCPRPGRGLRRGWVVWFAGVDLVHLEQDQPERFDALDQPVQRGDVSLTGSQAGSPGDLPQFHVIEFGPHQVARDSTDLELVYAETFRHLTCLVYVAFTPTLGCGWRPGITHRSPAAGGIWLRPPARGATSQVAREPCHGTEESMSVRSQLIAVAQPPGSGHDLRRSTLLG